LKQVKMIMKYYWSYIIIFLFYFSMMKLNWILFECMLIDE
jgi:hypothetical protein